MQVQGFVRCKEINAAQLFQRAIGNSLDESHRFAEGVDSFRYRVDSSGTGSEQQLPVFGMVQIGQSHLG